MPREGEGLRAAFDISGSVVFTPRLIALMLVAVLSAILVFTWMVTSRPGAGIEGRGLSALERSASAGATLQGMSFVELKRDFLDPAATDFRRDVVREKALGQRVIWSGLVKSVNSSGSLRSLDVVMEGADSRSFTTLEVLDLPNNVRLLGELSRGSRVLFSGKISGFDTGGPNDAYDFFRVELSEGILLE